jgi:hypothetical protein
LSRGSEQAAADEREPGCRLHRLIGAGRQRGVHCSSVLERDQIVGGLARLAELLAERGVQGELCLLGGTAMVLAFDARASTKDIDAVFEPASIVRELASLIEREQDLPEGWLNDAAKGFLSARHDVVEGDLPQFPALRVTAPTAEYLFAMKAMASRIGLSATDPSDVNDLRFLIGRLGLETVDQGLEIVARYYPADRVPARTAYLLEELFAEPRT